MTKPLPTKTDWSAAEDCFDACWHVKADDDTRKLIIAQAIASAVITERKACAAICKEVGYDGGGFFSPDGTRICYRAYHPRGDKEIKRYKDLLARQLVEPARMEIFICNVDGTDVRQVGELGSANFCPFFHPSGEKIIFATNHHEEGPRKRNFDLFMVDLDGKNLERVTFHDSFDAFPMFSPDGKSLVWCSNRFAAQKGDTNIFIADWVE